jgi:transcriptional regulator with XRE-family HTH domain
MNRLRELRLELGMTRENIASLLNKSYSTISHWEQNYRGAFDNCRNKEIFIEKLEMVLRLKLHEEKKLESQEKLNQND